MPLSSSQAAVDESLAQLVQTCFQLTVQRTCNSKLLGGERGELQFGSDVANNMICTMYHSTALQSDMLV